MRTLVVVCAAAVPAFAAAQGGSGGRDASAFFDSGIFELQGNYEMEGTVQSVDEQNDRITIAREDVPPATLSVAPDTRVRIDGDRSSLAEVRPGAEIRATFNVSRQTPLAIEIDVESPQNVQGEPGPYYDGYYDGFEGWGWTGYDKYYDADPYDSPLEP